jgi:Domain of unknown function (DUF4278)
MMKLIYRGVTYDYHDLKASSRLVRRETPYTLHYRGVPYQVTPKSETPKTSVHTVTHQLTYRGNSYRVTQAIVEEATLL